jgi:putative tricarboxylic transport membrane protein
MVLAALAVASGSVRDVLTIVAPASPGGGWDQTARALQQALATIEPGTSVQVENVPGAAGTIGLARFVSAERGNPHALLVTGLVMLSAIVTNQAPVTFAQTTPIARLTGEFEAVVVPAGSRFATLGDLVAEFRRAPTSVSWAGGSAGGTDDLLVRLLAEALGVPPASANYIAFSGGGPALAALLGGQITAGVSGYGEFAAHIDAGALRLLAVSAPARVPGIDAPTFREQGVDLDLANWRGLVAPPGLSDAEREALVRRVELVARSAQWRAILSRNGWEDAFLTGPAFRQFLMAEQNRVEGVLRRLGAQARVAPPRGFALTPRTLPAVALFALAVVLTGLLWTRHRRSRRASGSSPSDASSPGANGRVALLVGVLVLYAVALPVAGFILSSASLFLATSWLLGSRRLLRDAGLGLIAASVLFTLFTKGLALSLPLDPFTALLAR